MELCLEVSDFEDFKTVINHEAWPANAFGTGIKNIQADDFKYQLIIKGIQKNRVIESNKNTLKDIKTKYGITNLTRRFIFGTKDPTTQ